VQFLVEFGVPKKLIRLVKICLNEIYVSKHLSAKFYIQTGVKQGDALSPPLFSSA
jgi:hypothetical protein